MVLCGWALGETLLGVVYIFEPQMHVFITLFLMIPAMVISVFTFIYVEETPVYLSKRLETSWKDIILLRSSVKEVVLGCSLMFTLQMFYYRTQFTLDRFGISLTLNTIIVGIC